MTKENFKKRVLFVGIPDMAYVCLDGLMASGVNVVGVLGAKKNHPTYNDFKNFVNGHGLNFIEYDNLDNKDFIEKIEKLNADIAVVCSFNYKIPKKLLEAVKGGFVNIHPSLLPDYRGANPYSTVILNKEPFTGVTLHFMDETFDTGDIISQEKLHITPIETMGTLFNRLNLLGLDMLLKTLKTFENQELSRKKQPSGNFIEGKGLPEEKTYINYDDTAEEIERQIRALNPFIVASTSFRGTPVKIFSAIVVENEPKLDHENGTIAFIKDEHFFIKTKNGLLAPKVLQFGTFFLGSSRDFITILNPKTGERFE